MRKCLKIHIKQKLETKNDDVVADMTQYERNNIKCNVSVFKCVNTAEN